jgi:REP element-mobilizing transposase RayT
MPGTPVLAPDPQRHAAEVGRMSGPSLVLSMDGRGLVESTIREHAAIRGWRLVALNVRSNHVHVVLVYPDGLAPERAMEQFKAWSTRRLREAGLVEPEQRVWTEHGSTRWINSDSSLKAAIDYVLNHQ